MKKYLRKLIPGKSLTNDLRWLEVMTLAWTNMLGFAGYSFVDGNYGSGILALVVAFISFGLMCTQQVEIENRVQQITAQVSPEQLQRIYNDGFAAGMVQGRVKAEQEMTIQ